MADRGYYDSNRGDMKFSRGAGAVAGASVIAASAVAAAPAASAVSAAIGTGAKASANALQDIYTAAKAAGAYNKAVDQVGYLSTLFFNGQSVLAVKVMEEMAQTPGGRAQLLEIHKLVSRMLPYAISPEAFNLLKSLQDVSGTLHSCGN